MQVLGRSVDQLLYQRRRHDRSDVKIIADIRVSRGLRNKVRIVDLSRTGFQMECLAFIPDDRPVFMTLPGFVQLECAIKWRSEWHYGCAFNSPLHEGVHDHIVTEYPILGTPS
ncbi:MAG: PilZ domain-containing protein [Sphingorhabdus sp.]